ncbi:porin family protein [Marinagarivorans algicola]|uniref:porin family protein n=1 Tax=Marinagarivorans algicola TaxID=1513270 RepID=UPI0006B67EBE|nr:outer membrane beta-barrel protein [Marinagarivorans algicola]
MKLKKVLCLSVALSTMSVMAATSYAEQQLKVFASVGSASHEFGDGNYAFDDSATSYGLGGLLRFNQNFAAEFRYDNLGEIEQLFADNTGSHTDGLSLEGYSVGVLGGIPVGDTASIYAKVGVMFWDAEAQYMNNTLYASDEDNSFYFGFGGEFMVSNEMSVAIEYTMMEADVTFGGNREQAYTVNNIALTLGYSF